MQCPVCQQHSPDSWSLLHGQMKGETHMQWLLTSPLKTSEHLKFEFMHCANPSCGQLIVQATVTVEKSVEGNEAVPESVNWTAFPKNASRSIDPLVPEPLRTDYLEAAALVDVSPRMSATLSRSIIADLLKSAGCSAFNLETRVDEFVSDQSVPSGIRDNLHHLREVGNFGSHTQVASDSEVLSIGRDEAIWALDVIDRLFDYLIVAPSKDASLRASMDERIKRAGRKPIEHDTSEHKVP